MVNGGLFEQLAVDRFLCLGNADVDVHFYFGQQALLDLPLDSSQHEGTKDLVQLLYHFVVLSFLLGVAQHLVGLVADVEPLVKIVTRTEDLRQQEVEKTPQFVQVVLEGRTCEQQALLGIELANAL